LRLYRKNSRTHPDTQIAQIATAIQKFGWTNPILIGPDDVIIAGEGRLLAAEMLGIQSVPVIVLEHLSAAERRALVIADNRIALSSGWNEDVLGAELKALEEEDFDLSVLGLDQSELEKLLADESAAVGGGEGGTESGDGVEMKEISVTAPQYAVISEAVSTLRSKENDQEMSEGRALELICADFLSGK
jgi:hypothetical protein